MNGKNFQKAKISVFAAILSLSTAVFSEPDESFEDFPIAVNQALNNEPCIQINNPSFVQMLLDNNVLLSISIDRNAQRVVANSTVTKIITIDLNFELSASGKLTIYKSLLGTSTLNCKTAKDQEACKAKASLGLDYFNKHSIVNGNEQKDNSLQCLLSVLDGINNVL